MHWHTSYGRYDFASTDKQLALNIFTPKRFQFVISANAAGRDLEHYEQWFNECETTEELMAALNDCYSGWTHGSDQIKLDFLRALAKSHGLMWDYQRVLKRLIKHRDAAAQAQLEINDFAELLPAYGPQPDADA